MTQLSPTPSPLTRADLAAGLRNLGLQPGMGVIVHSSFKSFGPVVGGPLTVISALMDAITPDGTLLMPSFNHAAPFAPGGPGVYDPQQTPTANGTIPDHFWRLPGVHRSLAPTHPVAAWGRHAQRYTENHHRTVTFGADSPIGLLWRDGGLGLLLGTTYAPNSFHHVAEAVINAPCLGIRNQAYPVRRPDGRLIMARTWTYRERACPITDDIRYAPEMAARGLHRQAHVGASLCTLFRLDDCLKVITPMLREGTDGLPPCSACPIRPNPAAKTVPSDWDTQRDCLLPGAEA